MFACTGNHVYFLNNERELFFYGPKDPDADFLVHPVGNNKNLPIDSIVCSSSTPFIFSGENIYKIVGGCYEDETNNLSN